MKKRHMISPEFSQRLIWGPLRAVMILFCSLQIDGIPNLKKIRGNMIIASSHQSEIDPLLIVACLPFFSRLFPIIYVTREKKFYTGQNWKSWQKIVYGGSFFRFIGGYQSYVGLKDYGAALPHHLETLKLGKNVGIFPTGKRVKGKDKQFKVRGGVSFLAQQSGASIVPVLIQGLDNLTLRNVFSRKMKVIVRFGTPFYLEEIVDPGRMAIKKNTNDYEVAAAKIWQRIERLSEK